jgi:hypothetical protein
MELDWPTVKGGAKLGRQMVEKHFGNGDKQAKRDLAELTAKGSVVFVRTPRPGHYALCTR